MKEAHWNHRIIEHRHSSDPEYDVYYTVHEVYYGFDGLPQAYTTKRASPRNKLEAEQIARAFDNPAVAWVDDSSFYRDPNGFADYHKWGWLVEKTKRPSW